MSDSEINERQDMPRSEDGDYLNVSVAALLFDLPAWALRQAIADGEIKAIGSPPGQQVRRSDVQFLEQRLRADATSGRKRAARQTSAEAALHEGADTARRTEHRLLPAQRRTPSGGDSGAMKRPRGRPRGSTRTRIPTSSADQLPAIPRFRLNISSSDANHVLGPLESRIMQAVWQLGEVTVSQVHEQLLAEREIAYTTVMTTMMRLAQKNILRRWIADGRSYLYAPVHSRAEFGEAVVRQVVEGLLAAFGVAAKQEIIAYLQSHSALPQ